VLLGALAISNVSGYVFYIAMSRLLTPDRYGALGALISMITIIAVPAAAIHTVIARRAAATTRGTDHGAEVGALLRAALRGLAPFAVVSAVVLLAVSPLVASFLHLGSVAPAAIIAVYVVVALIAPVLRGAVHGLFRYGVLAGTLVTITLIRLGFGIPLVALGWDLTGAALAFVVAEVCGLAPTIASLRPALRARVHSVPAPTGLFRELGRACLVVAAFSATTNLDVVQVRHYFPHRASGLYAAASLVGRAVLLASTSLVMIVFPRFAHSSGANDEARSALRWALTTTAVLALGATLIVAVAGHPLMRIVFGRAYGEAATVATVSAAGSALYSLSALLMYFHLAGTSRALWAVVPAVFVQSAGIVFLHSSILQVAWVTTVVAAALLLTNVVLMAAGRRVRAVMPS
jgi:O-antigen/teichoic acid export membrane protein